MPTGCYVGFVARLVPRNDPLNGDIGVAVIDDANGGFSLDIVDERLIHGPSIDLALNLLDRTVIETERFGQEIGRPRFHPGRPGSGECRVGRGSEQRIDRLPQLLRRLICRLVARMDALCISGNFVLGVVIEGVRVGRKERVAPHSATALATLAAFATFSTLCKEEVRRARCRGRGLLGVSRAVGGEPDRAIAK